MIDVFAFNQTERRGTLVNQITTVGVDLAKEVIVVCAGDAQGRVLLRKQLSLSAFAAWAANLPACTMGMEACSSAHHWVRVLGALGHRPKLMAAELVAPFRMSRGAKNDRNDAEAILVAVAQPTMRFVSPKSIEQQTMLAWHRCRAGYMQQRTSLLNRTRGLLAEFGIWVGRSAPVLVRRLPGLMEDACLPDLFKPILLHTLEHLRELQQRIQECDARIEAHAKASEQAQRIQQLSGVGALSASALVATIGHAGDYRNGRQLAAWAGLVPRQHSSGGKSRLGKITKRGDRYLRGLMAQGARSTLQAALKRQAHQRSRLQQWIVALHARVGYHKTLVAIANKHLRMIWAILAKGENYDPDAWRRYRSAKA
jgi:transposase